MNKTVLPNISIKEKLNSEEFENLSTPVENALLDTRKKLADIDKEFADYVFLAKPVYERNGQTTEVQGMVHIGPKGFYEKINEDIEKSEIALHEGSFSEDPANGLRFSDEKRKKSSKNFVDQMAYLRMNDGDIAADISNEEINRIMAGKLSEKEFEYWIKRREIGGMVAKSLPDLIKHWIQKSFTKKEKHNLLKPEMIDDSFFSVANLEGVLSKERVEETAKQTTEKLAELLSEFIAEHNAFVHQVNNTKNRPEQKDLFEALKVWRHETFNPLRYFWAKQSTPEKNDWLDQQLFRFINPEFNIEIADDETILEERNHLLVNTLSNSEEVEDQKNIHANYGQAHLSGIHDVMQYENWKLKDIELTPVKFKKISWWKRAKNFAKAPFSLAKKIPKFFRLAKLSNEAKKENKEIFKQQESQTTEHRKNLNEEISEKNKKPELKLEKTKKPEESKDESLDTAA